jgi:dienelactone hydrolase
MELSQQRGGEMSNLRNGTADVDGIPVVWVQPEDHDGAARIALWLPWLTGTKEDTIPFLQGLASRGFTAVSFDLWQHGERGTETAEQMASRVFGGFRRHMWPILGQTTLDALRITDWAAAEFGPTDMAAGGVSAGGDIAVALAGIDQRISRVAAIAATPDWTRSGMRDISDPSRVVPQGEPGAYAQWFYNQLDPLSHLNNYAHAPAIAFECGADDTHVGPEAALRFRDALAKAYPDAGTGVQVRLHPGIGHLEAGQNPALFQNCLAWLAGDHPHP